MTSQQLPGKPPATKRHWPHAGRRPFAIPKLALLPKECVAVTLMLAAQFVAPAATVCILAGLAVWALSSSKAAIQALCLTVVLSAPNSALGSSAERAFTLKWLVLGAAVVRAAVAPKGSGLNLARVCGPILAFAVCIGLSSLLFGADPGLSLLKLATFVAGSLAILILFKQSPEQPTYWTRWSFTVYCSVLLLSLPLTILPQGYSLNNRAFQGILVHPQAYGVYMIPITAFLTVGLLFRELRGGLAVLACSLGWVTTVASGARTAVGAFLCASVALMLTLVVNRRLANRFWRPDFIERAGMLAAIAIVVIGFARGQLWERGLGFLNKAHLRAEGVETTDFLAAAFEDSRGQLVRNCLQTFESSPIVGVGFGAACAGATLKIELDEFTGLPVSAPTEQGFMPTAVLAQTGMVGALLCAVIIVKLSKPIVVSCSSPAVVVLFLSTLFLNLGEMMFFSIGGMGLYVWLMFGLAGCIARWDYLAPQAATPPLRAVRRIRRQPKPWELGWGGNI